MDNQPTQTIQAMLSCHLKKLFKYKIRDENVYNQQVNGFNVLSLLWREGGGGVVVGGSLLANRKQIYCL